MDDTTASPESQPTGRGPALPIELILRVIECLVDSPTALLRRRDPRTRALLSFTTVCRSTRRLASLMLRQHCACIESARQLAALLTSPHFASCPAVRLHDRALSWRAVTSLHLAPFGASLDDQPTALWVRELFCHVCDSLRRLVVDMPFASLDRYDDHLNVRATLRDGFERLTRLEEFICLGEYPQLSTSESTTDVWRLWPELRRLMLFHVPLADHWLWWNVATLPRLEFVWFIEPKPGIAAPLRVNIKKIYFSALPREDPLLRKKLTVAVADSWYAEDIYLTDGWQRLDPEGCMNFRLFSQGLQDEGRENRRRWLQRHIERGTLWDLEEAERSLGVAQPELNGSSA